MPKQRKMASYSDKEEYVKRLQEAADTTSKSKKEIKQDEEIDQVFEPQSEESKEEPVEFLKRFWDSLVD